jgi:hypothetical protein
MRNGSNSSSKNVWTGLAPSVFLRCIGVSGTILAKRPSVRKRFSRTVVGMVMKGGSLLVAAALAVGSFAVIANAESIKAHLFDGQKQNTQLVRRNVTMVPKLHRLMNLKYRTAKHSTPDALVYIPAGFDPDGPLNVLVYNHGLTNDVDEAFEFWELDKAFRYAPKNTIMIVPEWARDPEAYSSAAGPFHQPGFWRNMLTEIMAKTPELSHRNIEQIGKITIATFSGGFRATQTQIEKNGMEDKVVGVMLLDSLYEDNYFDGWLKRNIHELAAGRKFYHNFYFDTAGNSMRQLARLRKIVADAGLPQSVIYHDRDHPKEVVSARLIQQHPILYVYTTMYDDKYSAHQAAAALYFPEALKAAAANDSGVQIASEEQPRVQ